MTVSEGLTKSQIGTEGYVTSIDSSFCKEFSDPGRPGFGCFQFTVQLVLVCETLEEDEDVVGNFSSGLPFDGPSWQTDYFWNCWQRLGTPRECSTEGLLAVSWTCIIRTFLWLVHALAQRVTVSKNLLGDPMHCSMRKSQTVHGRDASSADKSHVTGIRRVASESIDHHRNEASTRY